MTDQKYRGATTRLDATRIAREKVQEAPRLPVLTVLEGHQAGQSQVLSDDRLLLGRERDCLLCFSDSGVSRHHAEVYRGADGRFGMRDLNSTNGTYINGLPISRTTLRDGDIVHLGPVAVLAYGMESQAEIDLRLRQYEQSVRDELTGLYNRRFLLQSLRSELAYSVRYQDPLSILMFDIDYFKRVNDRHGHQNGDRVLCALVEAVGPELRAEDVFARYGGEEFTVILRGHYSQEACDCAERIRRTVAKLTIALDSGSVSLTISLGVASLLGGLPRRPEDVLAEADRNLYRAKKSGRNRCVRSSVGD